MKHTISYRLLMPVTTLIMLVGLLAACGGGGATPAPQQQQPPQNIQTQPQAPPPDTTTIIAIFNDQTMSFAMGSGVGAVLPNATVIIEDPQNFIASKPASADGAFDFGPADFPPNFMTAPGTTLRIYQFTADTLRSDPSTVTIQLP